MYMEWGRDFFRSFPMEGAQPKFVHGVFMV